MPLMIWEVYSASAGNSVETITPICDTRSVPLLGEKFNSEITVRIRRRKVSLTSVRLFTTLDTVATETPARSATRWMLISFFLRVI